MTQMLIGGPFRMFRLTTEPGGLGLSCTPEGVSLAGVPLLRKTHEGYAPRPASEIASLLKTAYGDGPMALQSRLGAIAQALNSGDFATAMIAAVHTQTPELSPEAALRLVNAEQELIKYNYNSNEPRDRHGRWTSDGSAGPASITTPAIEAGEQTTGADNRPRRVAENTSPPSSPVFGDTAGSRRDDTSGIPTNADNSRQPTTLQQAFEQKYGDLKTEEFAKQVGQFGYWLEAHGRDISPAEKERALAEYSFLQDRLSSRIYREDTSAGEGRYLLYAAFQLYQGATNSGLVPVGHLPASMLAVAGAAAAFDTPSPSRLRPTLKPPAGSVPSAAVEIQGTAPGLTAGERVAQLAEQGLSKIQRERFVTLAVTETREGVRVISSSTAEVQPSVLQLLQKGEIDVTGIGHAEITGVEAAIALGLTPTGVAASRRLCPSCAEYLRSRGVVPLSPLRR
jgi:hypothetical protein